MQFYKEVKQNELKMYQSWVDTAKETAQKPITQTELILWEIGSSLEAVLGTDNIYCSFGGNRWLNINISPLSPTEWDTMMDIINSTTAEYSYLLDELEPTSASELRFHNGTSIITLNLIASQCDMITTGKLVPEKVKNCVFIKENK